MNFVDKQHVAFLQVGKDCGEVARAFDCRSGRLTEIYAEFVGNNRGERRLAQAGRTVKQHVVESFAARDSRFDEDSQICLCLVLPDIFRQSARA